MKKHMKLRHPRPYPAPKISEISENEDKREFIVYLPEEGVNKELFSLIQTLELEIKQKLVQIIDDLEIQGDNIEKLRKIKDKKSTIDELNQEIKDVLVSQEL